MRIIRFFVLLFIIVGAINWGLWGAFQYDFVQDLFGSDQSSLARLIYVVIGISGLYGVSFLFSKGTCSHNKPEDHE
ncbi:MAG: hypothetical protein A2888_00540 [Chlamydiae bacterium RIFCSPLOWO2_01_FULL_28_7]|nr:MAG: hypothetical protein A2888_00540 [Chlamydiae bacterium RIFCSPLOWO2_01_FULL_28_7]